MRIEPERKCPTCEAYDPDDMECHAEPPRIGNRNCGQWPQVEEWDWCMKWTPNAEERKRRLEELKSALRGSVRLSLEKEASDFRLKERKSVASSPEPGKRECLWTCARCLTQNAVREEDLGDRHNCRHCGLVKTVEPSVYLWVKGYTDKL